MVGAAILSMTLIANATESVPASAETAADAQAAKAAAMEKKLVDGLARLQPFAGEWSIVSYQLNNEQAWQEKERSTLLFDWTMGHRLLETVGHLQNADFRFSLSYDALKSVYRVALIDSGSGVLDIYEGNFDASDTLIVTNPDFYQWRIKANDHGWDLNFHYSKDQGKTWSIYSRHALTSAAN